MIKIPMLHNSSDKTDLIKKYYLALIPLILFSIYKNGILLFNNNLISFSKVLIPIYFYGISILVGFLVSKILRDDIKENILICLIISCTISINTNILFYPIVLFTSLFIGKIIVNKTKIKFNVESFVRLILILALLLNAYSYLNIGEKLNKFNYSFLDIFIGFGPGGIATTSAFITIISLIVLSSCRYYKKAIAIASSTKNHDYLNILLSGINYFSFVFIAPELYITPNSKEGMIAYGAIIGILSCFISYLGLRYEASYISTLFISMFIPIINKINNKKYLKN